MPTWRDFNVGVGDLGIVFEDAARTGKCEAGLEVPEGVAVEVGACDCLSVEGSERVGGPESEEDVPASQRFRHGSSSVFHFRQMAVRGEDEGEDI